MNQMLQNVKKVKKWSKKCEKITISMKNDEILKKIEKIDKIHQKSWFQWKIQSLKKIWKKSEKNDKNHQNIGKFQKSLKMVMFLIAKNWKKLKK